MKHCRKTRLPAQPHTRRECLVWARRLNRNFQSKNVNEKRHGAQANDLARTCVEQQQLLAERHIRRHLDWTRPRGIVTRRFNSCTQSRYSLCQSASNMRHKQQTIQQIHSRTGEYISFGLFISVVYRMYECITQKCVKILHFFFII